MKQLQKKFLAFLCAIAVLITSLGCHITIYAENETEEAKTEQALEWILKSANDNGSFGDDSLINDTAEVQKLLFDFEVDRESEWLIENAAKWNNNNDSLARLYSATGNAEYLEMILTTQNTDGGFGLNRDYTSDVWDSALVYEALVRSYVSGESNEQAISNLVAYLMEQQNDDGSYSYTQGAKTDYELTARIAVITEIFMQKTGANCDGAWLKGMENYLMQEQISFEADFINAAYQRIYMCLKGMVTDTSVIEAELEKFLMPDGSFRGDLYSTMAGLRLMREIEEINRLNFSAEEMKTELSSYVIYDEFESSITVKSTVYYRTNYDCEGKWLVEMACNDDSTVLEERTFKFDKTQEELLLEKEINVTGQAGSSYMVTARLIVDGEELFATTEELTVSAPYVDELVLSGEYIPGEGAGLSWNDISNEFYRFGYRLMRRSEGGQWESISLWDGEEKVRVLNVYPNAPSRNNLVDWMNTSIEGGEPAGKGLFEIDTVLIDDYNKEPDRYLVDEEGNYKYDVLYFGAYDCNGYRDLSNMSYDATRKFADAGRGVLFGHDTVCISPYAYHPNFARFADDLGIFLKPGLTCQRSSEVKVVNEGFLTSYPWKIEGTLDIPATHSLEQYTGGTTTATVWMELVNGGVVDEATGASSSAYLFSKNQLAMIQTGDQNGKATDDERKVLANTLFYLKQLSSATSTIDKSAYDMAVPGVCEISGIARDSDVIHLDVNAMDYGTTYQYMVEGLKTGADRESEICTSNVAEINAVSGIKGFAVVVNASPALLDGAVFETIHEAADQMLTYELPDTDEETVWYVHIRAVDNAGNIGEETVIEIPKETVEKPAVDNCFGTGYSLFGSEDITVYSSELTASGNVYSGGNFTFGGSGITLEGICEAVGSINAWAGSVNVADRLEQARDREMPVLHDAVIAAMGGAEEMEVLDAYNSTQVDVPTYCMTTTGAWCPELVFNESLVCEDTVNVGAESVTLGQEKDIAIYSVNGDISINSATLSGRGLIYAPNGTVTINVQNLDFAGSIIAKRIVIQGSVININKNEEK